MKKMGICFLIFAICYGCVQNSDGKKRLKLTHNLSVSHPFHQTIEKFAEEVSRTSKGKIIVDIFPNSVLGPDRTGTEQLQGGVVEMMKIGSSGLEPFDPAFSVFSLPYLFDSEEHFHKALRGPILPLINQRSKDRNHFIVLTYFTTGTRSFYTRDTPIMKPEDLSGLKIRVMNSRISIAMVRHMGGTPTPMPYGEIYTALQQKVIDGAENNPTALTIGKQGEIAKTYSFDEHVMMPDLLLMNTDIWESFSPEEQKIIQDAADKSSREYQQLWDSTVTKSLEEAKSMGVKMYYPEKDLFRQKVAPIYEEVSNDPVIANLIKKIRSLK